LIEQELERLLGIHLTKYHTNEVLGHIIRSSYTDRSEFNKPGEIIPVKNGLLNLRTRELELFTPEKIFTFKINAVFNGILTVNVPAQGDLPQNERLKFSIEVKGGPSAPPSREPLPRLLCRFPISASKGILLIDFVDARTNTLVWRAHCKEATDKPGDAKTALNKAVTKAFSDFPPKTKK
jgi:hypothetical protein